MKGQTSKGKNATPYVADPTSVFDEYAVVYNGGWATPITAFVYARDKEGAYRQASKQGIDRNSIIDCYWFGKYMGYGHI